jgi:hypothetical protein
MLIFFYNSHLQLKVTHIQIDTNRLKALLNGIKYWNKKFTLTRYNLLIGMALGPRVTDDIIESNE